MEGPGKDWHNPTQRVQIKASAGISTARDAELIVEKE